MNLLDDITREQWTNLQVALFREEERTGEKRTIREFVKDCIEEKIRKEVI